MPDSSDCRRSSSSPTYRHRLCLRSIEMARLAWRVLRLARDRTITYTSTMISDGMVQKLMIRSGGQDGMASTSFLRLPEMELLGWIPARPLLHLRAMLSWRVVFDWRVLISIKPNSHDDEWYKSGFLVTPNMKVGRYRIERRGVPLPPCPEINLLIRTRLLPALPALNGRVLSDCRVRSRRRMVNAEAMKLAKDAVDHDTAGRLEDAVLAYEKAATLIRDDNPGDADSCVTDSVSFVNVRLVFQMILGLVYTRIDRF